MTDLDLPRCPSIAEANEYWPARTQCMRPEGHEGAHWAQVAPTSTRMWEDVSFKMNFIEDEKP